MAYRSINRYVSWSSGTYVAPWVGSISPGSEALGAAAATRAGAAGLARSGRSRTGRTRAALLPVRGTLSSGWSKISHGDFSSFAAGAGVVAGAGGVVCALSEPASSTIAEGKSRALCIKANKSGEKRNTAASASPGPQFSTNLRSKPLVGLSTCSLGSPRAVPKCPAGLQPQVLFRVRLVRTRFLCQLRGHSRARRLPSPSQFTCP